MPEHDEHLATDLKALFVITTTPQPSQRIEEMTVSTILSRRRMVKTGLASLATVCAAAAAAAVVLASHGPTAVPAHKPTPTPAPVRTAVPATHLRLGAGPCCTFTLPAGWSDSDSLSLGSIDNVNYTVTGKNNRGIVVNTLPLDGSCGTANPNGIADEDGGVTLPPGTTSATGVATPAVISSKQVVIAGQAARLYVIAPATSGEFSFAWREIVSFRSGTSCAIIKGGAGTISRPVTTGAQGAPPANAATNSGATSVDKATVEQAVLSATLTTP